MFEEKKIGKSMAILAAVAAIGVGGAGIATAAVGGPGQGSDANTEKEDTLTGPDADRASAAAEQATGGKATEVDRESASSDKESGSQDAEDKGEFQTPANTAYEVEVDKGGKEIDVYLDKNFQVITTNVDTDDEEDTLTGPDADRASAAAEQATGGKATEVDRESASSDKESGSQDAEDKGEFQTPANTAYEVEVDKGGKEIDVYLDKDFQVITTNVGG